MGRLDNENKYQNDIRKILDFKIGSPYALISAFLLGPFALPLYDTLGNGIISGLRILPTLTEFIIIEIISLVILLVRLYRDYLLRKKIFPLSHNITDYNLANKKLNVIKLKVNEKNNEVVNSINKLINRNQMLIEGKSK